MQLTFLTKFKWYSTTLHHATVLGRLVYLFSSSFIKRHTSGTPNGNEWQQVTMSGTTSDSKWQRVTKSGKTSDNEWEQVNKSGFKVQNEIKSQSRSWRFLFFLMYNY